MEQLTIIDDGALHIVRTLSDAGHQALLVGGCVRDMLLGRRPKDWDVATDADPEAVIRLFERVIPVGVEFGIVSVVLGEGRYEVARFRSDGVYADHRRPESVTFSGPEEDARRRDFTINGLFFDPLEDRVIDHVGGEQDIKRRLIKAIGDPQQRFEEDYLRMLRAVRLAADLDCVLDEDTAEAIRERAGEISQISAERIRNELTRILTEADAAKGMEMLLDLGLMEVVLPEVAATRGVPQPPEHHPEGDVWTHLRLMLGQLDSPTPTLAWAVLLHDIGKPPTYTVAERIRFDGHDTLGAELAAALCQRLRMPNKATEQIRDLTAQHMRFRHVKEMRPSKLKRFLRQELFPELLELHRIDCLASHRKLDLYDFCKQQLEAAEEEELQPPRLLTGHDLMELGYEEGPRLGVMLSWLEDEQLEGRVENREQALTAIEQEYGPGEPSS